MSASLLTVILVIVALVAIVLLIILAIGAIAATDPIDDDWRCAHEFSHLGSEYRCVLSKGHPSEWHMDSHQNYWNY